MELVVYPNDILREVTQEVRNIDDKIGNIVGKMINVMDASNGVGLAGPQVGLNLSLFVIRESINSKALVFINPTIIEFSSELVSYKEGCLSLPGIYADLKRPKAVFIESFNENGKFVKLADEKFLARIIQHEFDHLKGVLFWDYYKERTRRTMLKRYLKKRKL